MSEYRKEHDIIGEKNIPQESLSGIHTFRAKENFQVTRRPLSLELIHAFGEVKLACARTNFELGFLSEEIFNAISLSCEEIVTGKLDHEFTLDALQGGAGTSTNMNVNEVIANRALQIMGKSPGEYEVIHPNDHVNLHQSTNDTYPTSLRVAAIKLINQLERDVVALTEEFQRKEKEFADVVKVGRTEMQDAVLTTLGKEMSAYADAFARDRWRIYKCEERLRVVNLGGTAIGTALAAPRKYVFKATEHLREITSFGLARAENLVEATQNTDVFVEVSGILKALASNLYKCANDLRLLSSGPDAGFGEITLPAIQAGSSIMPGKVNPVIPESVMQGAMYVFGLDNIITSAASNGNLELNAFMPLIAESFLSSIKILSNCAVMFRAKCVEGIKANREKCREHVDSSTATLTAFVSEIGYEKTSEVAKKTAVSGKTVKEILISENMVSEEKYNELISPESVMRLGF